MSEYCTAPEHHRKTRGKIRHCEWCGQPIHLGEHYEKWRSYGGGEVFTVYAHKECAKAWQQSAVEEGGIVYASRDQVRPRCVHFLHLSEKCAKGFTNRCRAQGACDFLEVRV